MRRFLQLAVLVALVFGGGFAAAPARAEVRATALTGCVEGKLPSSALSLICVPAAWNGDLVVWAHGYTAFNEPIDFQNLEIDGVYLPDLAQALGFAFATTTYRQNGLAILEGADDIRELVAAFPPAAGRAPARTYLLGASEGGIITTLLIEQSPELFSGGLSLCGPIGDFRKQINFVGDFRVLFDFFFPGVLPGTPTEIPDAVIENWETFFVPRIHAAVIANPYGAAQLLRVARAPIDPADPASVLQTVENLLWYNVFGADDAAQKLGGNPYDNRSSWYSGSDNDLLLNHYVRRFSADPAAIVELGKYQTTGNVTKPLVTLHTTGDEIIPFWHQFLYADKLQGASRDNVIQVPIFRYGHCNFTAGEALAAFGLLAIRVTGSQPAGIPQQIDPDEARRDFERAQGEAAPPAR